MRLKYIVRGASSEERRLFYKTAARVYRINLPAYEHSHQSCRHSNLSVQRHVSAPETPFGLFEIIKRLSAAVARLNAACTWHALLAIYPEARAPSALLANSARGGGPDFH